MSKDEIMKRLMAWQCLRIGRCTIDLCDKGLWGVSIFGQGYVFYDDDLDYAIDYFMHVVAEQEMEEFLMKAKFKLNSK